MPKKLLAAFIHNWQYTLVIFLGSLTWSLVMVRSGFEGFWGPNGHDGVWHIALANSLKRGSLEMPVFSGMGLQNYHIGFDLALAFISFVSHIPVSILYFQKARPVFIL